MMFDDYDDYDDYDDDEFLYDCGSDDDDYFMHRDGELIYPGDCYDGDYLERMQVLVAPAVSRDLLKQEKSRKDDAEEKLKTKRKGLIADNLSGFINNPKYSDVTLQVGKRRFHGHKIILCSWSEVFRKMFIDPSWMSPRRDEASNPGPELQELVEPDECIAVFKFFLKFMYSETVILNMENVFPILTLADKYMVQELRDACEDFLLDQVANIKGEEAMRGYNDAEKLSLVRVQEQCVRILEANISYLRESCVQSMPADLLIKLLQSSNLVVEDEHDVFKLALQWMNAEGQQEVRKGYAEEIFSLIRFPHMPSGKLKTLVDVPLPPFLEADFHPKLAELVAKAFEWRALAAEEAYSVMDDNFVEPRIYQNQYFSLHSSKSFMSQVSPDIFRKLIISTEEQEDYYHNKLNFRVASRTEKNIYKYGKNAWEVSAFASQDVPSNLWSINYVVQTGQDIGHLYRVAVMTRLTEEEEEDVSPVITLHHGTVVGKITLKVPSPILNITEKPTKVWVKVACFIAGKNEPISMRKALPTAYCARALSL